MKRVTINLNEETYQRVSEMAKAFEMTPSQLIRAMMNVGLQTGERQTIYYLEISPKR